MDKKNLIIIILAIAILGVCIGIGIVSVDKKTDTTPKSDPTDPEYKAFNEIDISDCSHKQCNKTYTFNNDTIKIASSEDLSYQVLYNKKVIVANQETPYLGDKIYTYDNKLIYLLYFDEEHFTVNVYDPDDDDFKMFTLDPNDQNWHVYAVSFTANKITFETSRFTTGNRLADVKAHVAVPIDNCEAYTRYKDYEAAKTFVINYTEGKFNPAINSQTILLKDFKDYHSLCD